MILFRIKTIIVLILSGFIFSCSTTSFSILKRIDSPDSYELIPLRTFFANVNTKLGYKISPDGTKLAWVEVVEERLELKVKDLSTDNTYFIKTPFINQDFFWGDESRYILFPVYSEQVEEFKIALIDTDEREKINTNLLLPNLSGSLSIHRIILQPVVTLVLKREVLDELPQYYLMRLTEDAPQQIDLNKKHIVDLIIKEEMVVARIRQIANQRFIEKQSDNGFITIAECYDINANIKLLSVDSDDNLNYISNCESDKLQLIRAKNKLDKEYTCNENLVEKCNSDVAQVVVNPINGMPYFSLYYEQNSLIFNLQDQIDFQSVADKFQGKINIISMDRKLKRLTFENSSHLGESYYLVDFEKNSIEMLSKGQLSDFQSFIKPAQFIDIHNESNTPLYGYYYPAQVQFSENKPAIILLHGGPEERSYPDYDREAILLSNRGYDVISLNYRGSKGFGHQYQQQAYNNIGVMLNDIESASQWLINTKNIDKGAIGLMGGSYGGYLALLASKYQQNKCVVSINGVYDLYQTALTFQDNPVNFFIRYYGGIDNIKLGKFDDYSPIKYSYYQNNHYMLVQSAYDSKVPLQTAVDFYDLIQVNNDVEFTVIKDVHDINKWYNRLESYRNIEVFLRQCLGGGDGGLEYYLLAKPFYE